MLIDGFDVGDRLLVERIILLYMFALNRIPDPDGLRAYVHSLKGGETLKSIAAVFLESDELSSGNLLGKRARDVERVPATAAQLADLIEALQAEEQISVLRAMFSGGLPVVDGPAYPWWLEGQKTISSNLKRAIDAMRSPLALGPVISFVVIVDDPDVGRLAEMIESIRTQLYDKLEVLLVVRRWTRPSVISFVRAQARLDFRIKIITCSWRAGVASAFNAGIRVAAGDFVGRVNPEDRLAQRATLEIACASLTWPHTRVFFTDEDAITANGLHHTPRLKADWDSDRMLVQNQVGQLSVFQTGLINRLGGMSTSRGGAEDFDLALRTTFAITPAEIRHIPQVLYHRREPRRHARAKTANRQFKGSTQKTDAVLHAADAFVKRTRLADAATRDPRTGVLRLTRRLPAKLPLVSIIIPHRNRMELLSPCVEGLLERTAYKRIEIIIVDNGSRDAETLEFLQTAVSDTRVKVLSFNKSFDWSAINNLGVKYSSGDVILLLNNDTEVIHSDWLDEIVKQTTRPEVGIVGAKLLYPPHGTIQHAGIVLAPDGAGKHAFRHAAGDDLGYLDQLAIVRTVSAVTGACAALRREVFHQVGGLRENALQVTNGDVDLCLRVQQHGYRVVWTPFARLWHKELATRGADTTPDKRRRADEEQAYLIGRWAERLREDPYWNPNLEVREDGLVLAVPSRVQRAWDHASDDRQSDQNCFSGSET